MKQVHYSTSAKKDLKRYRNNIRLMKALYEVMQMLIHDIPLPQHYRPHMLKGQYAGCMECHIGSDFLLIWIDEASDVIEVIRLGSHAEVF